MSDPSEVVFTGPFEREVRVSADRRTVSHRAAAWFMEYTPDQLLVWIEYYERLAHDTGTPRAQADVEVLHKARDLLASEWAGS